MFVSQVQTEHDTDWPTNQTLYFHIGYRCWAFTSGKSKGLVVVIFVVTLENKIYFYTVLLKLGKVKLQFYRYKRLIEAGADLCQAQISLC